MRHRQQLAILCAALLVAGVFILTQTAALAAPAVQPPAQAATNTLPPLRVEIPTNGESVNVRTGPATEYDQVGVLVGGQSAEILGRSPDGRWVQIVYIGGPDNLGWVFAPNVRVVGDIAVMPTVMPPPTATLPPTDPFFATPNLTAPGPDANRLPTFTPPAIEVRPTLLPAQGNQPAAAFPPAILIIVLVVLGSFGGLLSLMRSRQ